MSNTDNTDNFDSPDDMDPVLDKEVEFDEFEEGKGKSLGASLKGSPLFKFGIVALVIIIVIGIVSIFGGESVDAPTSVVGKGVGQFKEAPGIKEVTPVMKEAIEEKNDQRIDEAQKQGISAIPTPIAPPKTLLEIPQEEAQSEDPLLRWQQMQTERAKAQREQQLMQDQRAQTDPQREQKLNGIVTGMTTQMSQVFGELKQKDLKHMSVYDVSALKKQGGSEGGRVVTEDGRIVQGSDAAAAMAQTKKPTVIIPAGKVEYAQMMLEANSDIPGPVVALLGSGQFSGAKLLGKFTTKEDYLVITFTTMVTKKGTSVPINAYALDPNTSLTGVATEVDHRYWKRIILPAAAKFVEGYGDALAESMTTTTQSASSTTTTSEEPDAKEQLGEAVSEAASKVGEILDDDGQNTMPLVVVAAGTPLGILFMDSVTDNDILQVRSGVTPNAGANGQGQGNQSVMYQNGMQQQPSLLNQLQLLQSGLQSQQFMQQNNAAGSQQTSTQADDSSSR